VDSIAECSFTAEEISHSETISVSQHLMAALK